MIAAHGMILIWDRKLIKRLAIANREAYLEICECDSASVNAHLAVLAYIRGNLDVRAEYTKRLPTGKLNEVLEIIMEL